MLAIMKPVSVLLPKVGIDIYGATLAINSVISWFQENRENAHEAFKETWKRAHGLACHYNMELLTTQTARKQQNWDNPSAEDFQEYFRWSIYTPFIDQIISDPYTCFQGHNAVVMRLSGLVPMFIYLYMVEDIAPVLPCTMIFWSLLKRSKAIYSCGNASG